MLHLLEKKFGCSEFDCGQPAINKALQKYAWQNHASDSSKTYVALDGNNVIGFFSLVASSLDEGLATDRIAQGQPRGAVIPAIKLTMLGVDQTIKEKGLGRLY